MVKAINIELSGQKNLNQTMKGYSMAVKKAKPKKKKAVKKRTKTRYGY